MRFYIEITGYIKNHENFKILFWSRESEKTIFTIFPEFLRAKIWNTGFTSETTIPEISSETTETRPEPPLGPAWLSWLSGARIYVVRRGCRKFST